MCNRSALLWLSVIITVKVFIIHHCEYDEFLIIPPHRNDLHRQHEIALAAKKQLRKVLRDYEHEFTTAHGR